MKDWKSSGELLGLRSRRAKHAYIEQVLIYTLLIQQYCTTLSRYICVEVAESII